MALKLLNDQATFFKETPSPCFLDTSQDFTIMGWGNSLTAISGIGLGDFKELGYYSDIGGTGGYCGISIIKQGANQVVYGVASLDGVVAHATAFNTIVTGTWFHAALTYDSTTHVFTFYLNGVASGTVTLNINALVMDTMTIGRMGATETNLACERYISYQAKLSDADILAQYQSSSLTPVRALNLFTNTPTINNNDVEDLSGNGHDWDKDIPPTSNYFPGPFDSVRCETLTCSKFCKDLSCPPSVLYSGIYYLQLDKTNDTIYDANRNTSNVKIPNPFVISAMIGD